LASRADQLLYPGHAENSLSYLLCRRDEPRKTITSDAVHFAEHLITDRAPDDDIGLSSFDTAAPDGAMFTTGVKDFSIVIPDIRISRIASRPNRSCVSGNRQINLDIR